MSVAPRHAADSGAPIAADTFAALMASLIGGVRRVAVAVSGGADSMALALLAQQWADQAGCEVVALTVDHRLRAESTLEAARVGEWMAARGIQHHVLNWDEGRNLRHLNRSAQDDARQARLRLLSTWCAANDVPTLLLAHHADDQIETFFMRLARGSGVQGLSAMSPVMRWGNVRLLRPLLDVSKADLVATCSAFGQSWIADPSNDNPKYARTRFRQAMKMLGEEGFTRPRVLATIKHQRRAHEALSGIVNALFAEAVMWSAWGTATVDARKVDAAPEEVRLRLLSRLLCAVSGQMYGPRFESLERLSAKLHHTMARTTLHGCTITRAGDVVEICREPSAISDVQELPSDGTTIWDGRFEFKNASQMNLRVRGFEAADQGWWKDQAGRQPAAVSALVRRGLPVLEDDHGIIAMPVLGLWRTDLSRMFEAIKYRFVAYELWTGTLEPES